MAATAEVIVQGRISNHPTGSTVIGPLTASSAAANGQRIQTVLASGDNTITVPSTPAPSGVVIQLPTDNTATVKLGGSSGTELSKTGFAVLTFNTASLPTSIILNSSALQTGKQTEITFF